MSSLSFQLLDGTSIPWLAWGNGSGQANKIPLEGGRLALAAGIRHIDTAQLYGTEAETGQAIVQSSIPRNEVYVTSKLSEKDDKPVSVDKVRSLIEESISKIGFIPDLFLIHKPFVAEKGQLKAVWSIMEDMKSEGRLKSIGVSNFRLQDLETILDGARFIPVVNQLEYHPYVLTHLKPVLDLQARYGILTESFGPLTPIIRHPTGGPLKPILERIAQRLTAETGKKLDSAAVLLLWTRAKKVVAVSASGNSERIKYLGDIYGLPSDLLTKAEVDEITSTGEKIHFRHYREHMEVEFPLPDLPSDI